MVGLPVLETETSLMSNNQINDLEKCNESRSTELVRIMDQPFVIPRVTMSPNNGNDNYTLEFEKIGKSDKKKTFNAAEMKAEPVVLKKVAAGLKVPNGQTNKKDMPMANGGSGGEGGGNGGGSLSSGCSIVTISSVANSDPDPDYSKDPIRNGGGRKQRTEKWYNTLMQISVPFFIAGGGTIGAGLVLDQVQHWEVFQSVGELLILVPALLGLKGNLDMCLASRLSTQANLGNMHKLREIMKMIIGNIALVQIQAIVAAVLVAIFAISVGAIQEAVHGDENNLDSPFKWNYALLLAASSVCTATSSCFILDFVMIAVIMISHKCKMNPDNLATPLAASVGDVVSISVLSRIASAFFLRLQQEQIWILYVVLIGYFLLLPFWIAVVMKNKYTRNVLTSGWVPVLSALFISGLGGLILNEVVDKFTGFVVFQPIINGIGGNLVSVQASRISTMLHQTSILGILPPHAKLWVAPWTALFKGAPYAKTARLLIGMAISGQLVFVFLADYIKCQSTTLDAYFVISYIVVSVLQVMLLLYVAHIIIHAMWRHKIDPDNSAIPYLTALGDLSGTMFLALAFWFLTAIHKEYKSCEINDVATTTINTNLIGNSTLIPIVYNATFSSLN
ncbi:PREDICTED: solute carrier family 41 member 3-like [Polistes canadensis]|uniref:solute carrier family 41 member 3-like n=1 Tax=Polistes canadensis TaxID=91411 RepID=UPI0007190691|nr:PREDICTED: solute carrier family 41 member 3-like [Polistes canadensis]XP_014609560.1 PREDICTED: solute carrier family 41 member 3-like [Polistes canadensis]